MRSQDIVYDASINSNVSSVWWHHALKLSPDVFTLHIRIQFSHRLYHKPWALRLFVDTEISSSSQLYDRFLVLPVTNSAGRWIISTYSAARIMMSKLRSTVFLYKGNRTPKNLSFPASSRSFCTKTWTFPINMGTSDVRFRKEKQGFNRDRQTRWVGMSMAMKSRPPVTGDIAHPNIGCLDWRGIQ